MLQKDHMKTRKEKRTYQKHQVIQFHFSCRRGISLVIGESCRMREVLVQLSELASALTSLAESKALPPFLPCLFAIRLDREAKVLSFFPSLPLENLIQRACATDYLHFLCLCSKTSKAIF